MNIELTALLRKARGYCKRGWTQGTFARAKNDVGVHWISSRARKWCAAGACQRAAAESGSIMLVPGLIALGKATENNDLQTFNDAPGRTQQDVLNLFDRAIEKAEAS